MNSVLLVHWNRAEAEDRLQRLRQAGFAPLLLTSAPDSAALKRLLETPIHAIVIDLSRRPSLGRDLALHFRRKKATRDIPIVFVDAQSDTVSHVKALLPDAAFAEWPRIPAALQNAIKNPPARPLVPNAMAGYSGTPLPKKLGIKPGAVVALVNAPDAFERLLDPLPDGVLIKDDLQGQANLVVLFVSRMADLHVLFPQAGCSLNAGGRLWIAWPKQASRVQTDVTQPAIREFGLAAGWVDFKICSINETWSGLAFTRRPAKAPRAAS